MPELGLRTEYNVNLVVIKRKVTEEGEDGTVVEREVVSVPKPEDVLHADDTLVLVGPDEALARLPKE